MLPVVTESKTDLATSKLIEELGAIVQTKPSELYEASFDGLKVQEKPVPAFWRKKMSMSVKC